MFIVICSELHFDEVDVVFASCTIEAIMVEAFNGRKALDSRSNLALDALCVIE